MKAATHLTLGARILLLSASLVVLGPAQTPLFQVLDNPVPWGAAPPDAIGDLDGDGDADIVSRNGVFQNDGHGRFSPVAGAPLAFPRSRTTLADVNNDGLLDVVSVAWSTYPAVCVRIDLNQGAMIFGGPVSGLPTVASPNDLVAGDVDADGDVDILIGATTPTLPNNTPVLWLNDGTGSFVAALPPFAFPSATVPAGKMFLSDLDNDGDLDAIFGGTLTTGIGTPTYGAVMIATNAGGIFTLGTQFGPTGGNVEIGNFDGDAFPDLVVSWFPGPAFAVIRGSATGFLAPVTTATTAPNFGPLIAVDLNGDGLDELIAVSGSVIGPTSLDVRSVSPAGTVGPPTQSFPNLGLPFFAPVHEWARDLDGDGDRDLIAQGGIEPVALMNDGAGALVAIGGRASGLPSLAGQHACDLDADGDPDVVGWEYWSPGPISIRTGVNDGAGWFTPGAAPQVSFQGGAYSYSLNPIDIDGDGDSDLYVAANPTVYLASLVDTVLVNNGGVFTQVATVTGTGPKSAFAAVDIDLDGDQDIVLGRHTWNNVIGGPMLLLLNLGGGGLSAPIPFGSSNHETYDVDVGDFDGNGLPDLFQTNSMVTAAPGQIDPCVLWLNTGAGFTEHVTGFSGFYTAAGDLNGDGRTDLVVDVQVWFSTGTGSLVPGPMLPSALVGPPILADVDQDGDLDLVESSATVFFNAGGGNFGPPVSYYPRNPASNYPWDIPSAVVDVDRDGDLDILSPGPFVFSNTLRQIARGSVARPGHPASIDLYGTPGGAWFLWASNGTASFPFPPWGTVLIDPASAQLGAMGTFLPATTTTPGTATLGVTVPNNPALVGWTTFWQAIDAAQMRVTNRIQITVLSY